jgi:hypothetical protein
MITPDWADVLNLKYGEREKGLRFVRLDPRLLAEVGDLICPNERHLCLMRFDRGRSGYHWDLLHRNRVMCLQGRHF